jgi:DNA mismatch repair ATPase MutS
VVDEELNERVTRLERQMTVIQKDVKDTRTLVAGIDHDVAEMKQTQIGHTGVLNAVRADQLDLREEMDRRFEDLERRMEQGFEQTRLGFEETNREFAKVHGKFATMKVSLGRIIELLEPERPA